MTSIDDYQNLIELLKKALEFYADRNNYQGNMGDSAMIKIDDYGSQARFALDRIRELEIINQSIIDDYNKYVDDYQDAIDNDSVDAETILNSMKVMNNSE